MKDRGAVSVHLAAFVIYGGFRILGASKKHAWERTKLVIAKALIDKIVEMTGIRHPDGIPNGHMQISFAGGPHDREVRIVEICGAIDITMDDKVHRYRRTDSLRGHSTIFEYEGHRP